MQDDFRVRLLFFFLTGLGLVLGYRLFNLQILKSSEFLQLAKSQQSVWAATSGNRGSILASDGFPLAQSFPGWVVWANPKKINDSLGAAKLLAPFFIEENKEKKETPIKSGKTENGEVVKEGKMREELVATEEERLKELLVKDSEWVLLKEGVEGDVKDNIAALSVEGLGFDFKERREYPEETLAASLLGFVGKDETGGDQGYFGLEGYYDLTLRGGSGERFFEKDAFGNPILIGDLREVAPIQGISLKIYIDRTVQWVVEEKLREGMERFGASHGTVVVMRPSDGAILASATLPSYNPERFQEHKQEDFVDRAVSMTFEPGSIFKVLIMAAALDAGAVKLDDKCDKCGGERHIGGFTIGTWDDKYYPESTPQEIIAHSDNVGMIWVGEKLGRESLYEYLRKFGIGEKTQVDLQGEANVSLRDKDEWGDVDVATASFGQGVAVTPIQMARAVSAIASGGVLPVPKVVDKMAVSGLEQERRSKAGVRVISESTARKMTRIMVNAVEKGEAKWTKLRGFEVAGKTGTAQIPVSGHYDSEKTIASFVGFAPASEPKFVMIVTLREPQSSPWASETAAPLWFSIAEELFPYFGIQPGR